MHRHDSFPSGNPVSVETLERRVLLSADLRDDGVLEIIGTRNPDRIFVTYGPDRLETLIVNFNRHVFSFPIADITRIFIQSGGGDDHVEFRAFARNPDRFQIPTTIYGSTGNDLIIGPGSGSRIYGGTGDDKIFGGFGRDIIYGEEGNDTLYGEQGNDYLSGDDGDDWLIGGLGFDVLLGGPGNDSLVSRNDLPFRNDSRPLEAQLSFDRLDGGPGNDRADADPLDRLISIERTFKAF